MPAAVAALLEAQPVEIEDAQDDERIPAELAADLGMSSVRFEPLIAGGTVGMLSIEPAPRGAAPELHSLLAMVAAAVARVRAHARERAPARRGGVLPARADRGRHARPVARRDARRDLRARWHARSTCGGRPCSSRRTATSCRARRATRTARATARSGTRCVRRPARCPRPQAAFDSGEPVVASGPGSPLIGTLGRKHVRAPVGARRAARHARRT